MHFPIDESDKLWQKIEPSDKIVNQSAKNCWIPTKLFASVCEAGRVFADR